MLKILYSIKNLSPYAISTHYCSTTLATDMDIERVSRSRIRAATTTLEMDKIRARGFLKYSYIYNPEANLEQKIQSTARKCEIKLNCEDWKRTELADMGRKIKFLLEIGEDLAHFVPNSKLHKMETLADVLKFYSEPTNNITKYAEMSRNDRFPKNLSITEYQRRFHPDDRSAPHGGISAFPGEMGEVFGLRNKRIYRQYKPKKHWFEYEDEHHNYDADLNRNTPWDPEVAKKMDSYTETRFGINKLK